MVNSKKSSKGRQKIDIVKMKNENNLQVTFSKRRAGLFKKASELCTLTGSEVAIVVFSPGEKAYSFGSPSVNEIIERFGSDTPHLINNDPSNLIVEAHRRANEVGLNKELGRVENMLEGEKKRAESLSQLLKANSSDGRWWDRAYDELDLEQLEQLRLALEALQNMVQIKAQKTAPQDDDHHQTRENFLPNILGRNGYGVNNLPPPPLNVFRPSVSSAFFPYDSKPPGNFPGMPFGPYMGPSMDENNAISVKNGPVFAPGTTSYGSAAAAAAAAANNVSVNPFGHPININASSSSSSGMIGGGVFGHQILPPYEFFTRGGGYGGGSNY